MKVVGARIPRYDGVAHVTGRTTYVDDVRIPGTLWVKALRSPHHNAGIRHPLRTPGQRFLAVDGVAILLRKRNLDEAVAKIVADELLKHHQVFTCVGADRAIAEHDLDLLEV